MRIWKRECALDFKDRKMELLTMLILEDYASVCHKEIGPPVPVEDILERYFDLSIAYVDFEHKYGLRDILGAIYIDQRMVCANESLTCPGLEGRLNFTFAHEAGHWVLHRRLKPNSKGLHRGEPLILCRHRDAESQIEWQANYFAGCLLMPEPLVQFAFRAAIGDHPLRLINETARMSGPCYSEPCVAGWPQIAEAVQNKGNFSNVSKQALIIRLQNLGLVINETPLPMNWATVRELTLIA
jgi:Zn-dependent peptidase ImmA (M78 family)